MDSRLNRRPQIGRTVKPLGRFELLEMGAALQVTVRVNLLVLVRE